MREGGIACARIVSLGESRARRHGKHRRLSPSEMTPERRIAGPSPRRRDVRDADGDVHRDHGEIRARDQRLDARRDEGLAGGAAFSVHDHAKPAAPAAIRACDKARHW